MTAEEIQEKIVQLIAMLASEFGSDQVADWLIDLSSQVSELEFTEEVLQ